MTTVKLSDLDKEEKKARDSLLRLSNRIKSDFSFKRIKTYGEYYKALGYSIEDLSNLLHLSKEEQAAPISFQSLKEKLEDLRISLDVEYYFKRNPIQDDPAYPKIETSVQAVEHVVAEEPDHKKDYGLEPSDKEEATLYWFQKKYAKEILDNTLLKEVFGQYLIAKAGDGKTFMLGAAIRRLIDKGWHRKDTISPWPMFVVTKASVVLQTERVLRTFFGIDTTTECMVVGIDQLRSRFGTLFLSEVTEHLAGVPYIKWVWRPMIHPKLIIWDEAHALKNPDSIQSRIGQSFGELDGVYQIFSSATPFVRVSEAKCFCVSTRLTIPLGPLKGRPLTNKNWNQFAEDVSAPAKPEDYNQEAVNRLTDIMDPYIVRVKGVKWQYNPKNTYELIDFETDQGREFYRSAEERFFRRKAKLEAGEISPTASKGYMLAIMTQYNIAAESNPDRARIIARRMYHDAQEGFSPVCTMKYKISISRILKILMEEYKVPRSQISVIWGGSHVKLSKKAEAKKKLVEHNDLLEALEAQGISLADIGMSDDEVQVQEEIIFPDELRLGTQNAKQREEEKNNFLSGKTTYCFFSIKAGGVGLSLHHTDELTTKWDDKQHGYEEWRKEIDTFNDSRHNEHRKVKPGKVRRKESGYALEEDIPFIPTKPRRLYGPPAYSAIDIIQFLGRCARLTSLSDTIQTLLFFRGTIEERVAAIYSIKLKCLTKVIRNRESWEDVILGATREDREAAAIRHMIDTGEVYSEEDSDGRIVDSDSNDNEEDEE